MVKAAHPASQPTLSVVTPSFNSGPYLGATLDSVASLRVPHEHIVVDGGSSDETVQQLEARNDRSLIWASEPDRGQTHAVKQYRCGRYHSDSKTASNPQLQQRESLEIRLAHARTSLERGPMRVINRLMSVRNSLISSWPKLPEQS